MNFPALIVVAFGVIVIVIAWRGSQSNVWNMLTGHPPGPHKAGALTPAAGAVASSTAMTAPSATPTSGVVGGGTALVQP